MRKSAHAPQPSQDAADLLAHGQLLPVCDVAEIVLGRRITGRTVLRWALNGRKGQRLPTRRGVRRQRCTTEACLRAWLLATDDAPAPQVALPDHAADVLRRLGLAS
ncbi:MAG: hypothetical protein INH34_19415 [Phycisphaerales bacterium]|nr:hypothetical protein [Phycisphaerales bacterium]